MRRNSPLSPPIQDRSHDRGSSQVPRRRFRLVAEVSPQDRRIAATLSLDSAQHPGQEPTGQDQRPRPQPRKACFSSGLVQSRLLSCPRDDSEASGQTGHVSRQVNDLTRHVNDLAGGGRKGLRGSRTGPRPTSICGKSVANRLRADPLLLCNLPDNVYLQHVFLEPPRGFEPRTYAVLAVRTPPKDRLLLVHSPAYPGIFGHA